MEEGKFINFVEIRGIMQYALIIGLGGWKLLCFSL